MINVRFLIGDDPAKLVMDWWARRGVFPELDAVGNGVVIKNYSWSEPGTDQPPAGVPTEALEDLGECYDEILSHLRYWKQTKDIIEKIWGGDRYNDRTRYPVTNDKTAT